ncbi:hypothetical protein A11A3_08910 [Alcanivorax hongdengensis A-11-3]|uniref:Outer membrane protein n=1 Tax=Alcanivorax hongdengensis A-11-3 TaxID=1177179 RepID=L0WDR0_9GAMM|nr:lipid A deacylase LpxR family protein [Alcanivorax hongdengensis]EKF74307.1 hypothetical protein A11A3_08910 [Alcanivorax hongdengensis A-11-3]
MRHAVALLLFACLFLPSAPLRASTFGFSWDNDLFVGTDRNYTNGVRISWVGEDQGQCDRTASLTCGVARGVQWLPGIDLDGSRQALTLSVAQIMITPHDITRSTPDYNDLPYVGYSNLELGLFSWNDDSLFGYGLRGGVVGPDSGAEQSQKVVHKITGSQEPMGWDNQLGSDAIGGLWFLYSHRYLHHISDSGLETELGYAWGVDANNFDGNAQAGGFIRIGRNLPRNFIPDYAGIGTAGSLVGLFDGKGFGWESFLGASGQYLGYSYLDEKSGPYDVRVRDGILTLVLGGGVHTDNFSFTMTLQSSSSPLRDSDDLLSFGNLSFMWQI